MGRGKNGLIKIPSNRRTRWGGRGVRSKRPKSIQLINKRIAQTSDLLPTIVRKANEMFTPDSVSPNKGAVKVIGIAFCRLADISLTQLMAVGRKVINKRSKRSARHANSNTSYYTAFRVIIARTHVAYYTRVKPTVKTKAAKRPCIIQDLPSSYTSVVSVVVQYLLFYLYLYPTHTRLATLISTAVSFSTPHAILIFSLITSHHFF